jgi:HEAT repeat protein
MESVRLAAPVHHPALGTPAHPPTNPVLTQALEQLEWGDFQERWEASKRLTELGHEAIEPLIALLETEENDPELCWFIARILGRADRPDAICASIALMNSTESEEVKTMAALMLANCGPLAIEPLAHLLTQPRWQMLAVQALSQTQHPDAIEPLITAAGHSPPEVRAAAISALLQFHDPRILPVLVNGLKDYAAIVRREATIGLGLQIAQKPDLLTEINAIELLKQRLHDLDLSVCQQAAIALSRTRHDRAALALFRTLQSPHTPVVLQVEIVRALGWMESLLVLEYLKEALKLELAIVCQETIWALGRITKPSLKPTCAKILIHWLQSSHPALQQPEVRQAIALELGRLGDRQAIPYIQKLQQDPDERVRIHAGTALLKIKG